MELLIQINQGLEQVAQKEIKEILGYESETGIKIVKTKIKKKEDLFLLNYRAQSINRVLILFNSFEYRGEEHLMTTLKQIIDTTNLDEWIDENFVVICENENKDEFISQEVAGDIGAHIGRKVNKKVNFKNPSAQFYVYITKTHCYFGLDSSGYDLSKREYRIFIGSDTLKGTTAYTLLRIGGYAPNTRLLDPFCRSGTIAIEAALYAKKFSAHKYIRDKFAFMRLKKYEKFDFDEYFDKLDSEINEKLKPEIIALDAQFKDVVAAKKNSKIAGIIKSINFSKLNLEWLDTKMGKKSLDLIATKPIQIGRKVNAEMVNKLYKELVYQAEYILDKNGKMAYLMQNEESITILKKYALNYKFKTPSEKIIKQGDESWKILVFEVGEKKEEVKKE